MDHVLKALLCLLIAGTVPAVSAEEKETAADFFPSESVMNIYSGPGKEPSGKPVELRLVLIAEKHRPKSLIAGKPDMKRKDPEKGFVDPTDVPAEGALWAFSTGNEERPQHLVQVTSEGIGLFERIYDFDESLHRKAHVPAGTTQGNHWYTTYAVRCCGVGTRASKVRASKETVKVPAGSFDCLKIEGKGVDTLWLAKGVGIVKWGAIELARTEAVKPGK